MNGSAEAPHHVAKFPLLKEGVARNEPGEVTLSSASQISNLSTHNESEAA